MSKLRIDILGTAFSIDARADEAYLRLLLENYRKMTDLVELNSGATVTDPLQVSVMAGIMLCDELYKEKKKGETSKRQVSELPDMQEFERRTLDMIARIEQVVN
ncbi:MAG: cell division protein ZapA [Spirochaetaceae bacterium]|jgi:cell division protein ZapA|nr:cell division protein ZapA [Spirochaetaceae bacterium]